MLTSEEWNNLKKHKDSIDKLIDDEDLGISFLKLIVNHLNVSMDELEDVLIALEEEEPSKETWPLLIQALLQKEEILVNEEAEESYSIGALSYYFQVSNKTVENWIKDGRFIGIDSEYDQYIQIDQDVLWKQSEEKHMPIKEIVANYELNNIPPELSKEDTLSEIKFELDSLEEKYKGKLDVVLKEKLLTSEEQLDFNTWNHFVSLWRAIKDEKDQL